MNRLFRWAFGVMILAFAAAPLYSAEKMVPQEGALELMLLRQPSVQNELKLSDAVTEKIHKYCDQQWEKAQQVGKLAEKEQDKEYIKMAKENDHFVAETLTKVQAKRLHQITLQLAGLLCVNRHDVNSNLKLTEDQKKRLPQLHKEAHQEVEELLYSTEKDQRQEKMAELREANHKRLMELLTDEQEVAWKEMIGAPFTGELAFVEPQTIGK